MTVDDLYHHLVSSIHEAQKSAWEDFGTVELVGCTSRHVATLLEQAVPFLNCQTGFKDADVAMAKDTFRFMSVCFRGVDAHHPLGRNLWWRLTAIRGDILF